MRLLLDEHISPVVARSLRELGHDVVAVAARDDLRGSDNQEILAAAASEGRVLVTADIRDFVQLGSHRLPDRTWHAGIVLVPQRRFPRSVDGFGILVRALSALMTDAVADRDPIGTVVWLSAAIEDD